MTPHETRRLEDLRARQRAVSDQHARALQEAEELRDLERKAADAAEIERDRRREENRRAEIRRRQEFAEPQLDGTVLRLHMTTPEVLDPVRPYRVTCPCGCTLATGSNRENALGEAAGYLEKSPEVAVAIRRHAAPITTHGATE